MNCFSSTRFGKSSGNPTPLVRFLFILSVVVSFLLFGAVHPSLIVPVCVFFSSDRWGVTPAHGSGTGGGSRRTEPAPQREGVGREGEEDLALPQGGETAVLQRRAGHAVGGHGGQDARGEGAQIFFVLVIITVERRSR